MYAAAESNWYSPPIILSELMYFLVDAPLIAAGLPVILYMLYTSSQERIQLEKEQNEQLQHTNNLLQNALTELATKFQSSPDP